MGLDDHMVNFIAS